MKDCSANVFLANPTHYDGIVMFYNCFGEELLRSGSLPHFDPNGSDYRRLFSDDFCRIFMMKAGERVVGVMQLSAKQTFRGLTGSVEYVLVANTWRRRGFAKNMILALHEEARQMGVVRMELVCEQDRPGARCFYKSVGYEPIGNSLERFHCETF